MTQWEKLLSRISSTDAGMRFDELRRVLENYGYEMSRPSGGGSHATFRKRGCSPITIPIHEPIKKSYIKLVRNVVEEEGREHGERR